MAPAAAALPWLLGLFGAVGAGAAGEYLRKNPPQWTRPAPRTEPVDPPAPLPPTEIQDPPHDGKHENIPVELDDPTVGFPIPEPRQPDIEIYPDQSDKLEQIGIYEAEDLKDPVNLDKGEAPDPDTEWKLRRLYPELEKVLRNTILGSGTIKASDRRHSDVVTSGGYEEARKEFHRIREALGIDPAEVIVRKGKPDRIELPGGINVSVRPYSNQGDPTVEIYVPKPDGGKRFTIKKRFGTRDK